MPSSNIIPENVAILATTFMLLHEEGGEVNMAEDKFNPCGTVACHAGWFAIARNLKSHRYCDRRGARYDFVDSAVDMARFLGFMDEEELGDFFEVNHSLWGNDGASHMFASAKAFGKSREQKLTLLDIGEHGEKV